MTARIATAMLVLAGLAVALRVDATTDPLIARGRYLVVAMACNDCHTPNWRESDGTVPQAKWLVGNSIGIRQSWGTQYPINIRLWFHQVDEQSWLFAVKTRGGNMQWHDLRHLTLDDQRAIYRFVYSLGPKGVQAPADVPPDIEPKTPYIDVRLHTPFPEE
jgi:hypothetical protein